MMQSGLLTPLLEEYIEGLAICRLATTGPAGPQLSSLWFSWVDHSIWLRLKPGGDRWTNLKSDAQVAVLFDDGDSIEQYRGVEIRGRAYLLEPPQDVERSRNKKYGRLDSPEGHRWVLVIPERWRTWGFR